MHMQILTQFYRFVHRILSGNEILTITKGHYCVVILLKLTRNSPNLDLVKVNAHAKSYQIPSIRSQDIERKRKSVENQEP